MKIKWLIVFILLIFISIFSYFFFYQTLLEPEFIEIKNIELGKIESQNVSVKAIAVFYNPNTFDAQLLNTEIKTYSNDVLIASISQTELSQVFAQSDFNIPISFNVDLMKLGFSQSLSGLLEQALKSERKIPIRFEGYCRIKSKKKVFKIPIYFEEELLIR